MVKKIVSLALVLALIALPAAALAKQGGKTKSHPVKTAKVLTRQTEKKVKLTDKKGTVDAAKVEKFIATRRIAFDNFIANMEKHIVRVGEIATKAEGFGIDITEAKTHLAKATELIATAKVNEENVMALYTSAMTLAPKERREALKAARAAAKANRVVLRNAHSELKLAAQGLSEAIDAYLNTLPPVEQTEPPVEPAPPTDPVVPAPTPEAPAETGPTN